MVVQGAKRVTAQGYNQDHNLEAVAVATAVQVAQVSAL